MDWLASQQSPTEETTRDGIMPRPIVNLAMFLGKLPVEPLRFNPEKNYVILGQSIPNIVLQTIM